VTPLVLIRYVAGRLAQAAAVLVAAYTVTFVILDALPGNAIGAITGGQSTDLTPQQLGALTQTFQLVGPCELGVSAKRPFW
jgi:peptide/nickel transport system permease protein